MLYSTTTNLRKSLQYANFDKTTTKNFSSIDTYYKYVKGLAFYTDQFTHVWQTLGFSHMTGKTSYHKSPSRPHKNKKSFLIGAKGAFYDFYTDEKGNVFEFLQNEKNYTQQKAYEFVAALYGLNEYTIGETKPTNYFQNQQTNQEELENEALTYFRSRIYKELGLSKEKAVTYFMPALDKHKGISIRYTDIEGETIFDKIDNEYQPFERIRLAKPYRDAVGKTTKYLSPKGASTYPYLTALAHAPETVQRQKTLFITEGEFKAFFGVQKLGLPFVGLGGISLTAKTEKNENGKTNYETAYFDEHTKAVLEKFGYSHIHLLFDSDAFDNKGKDLRHYQFYAAVKKAFFAAKNQNLEFTFSVVNPNSKAKGVDDLEKNYSNFEIQKQLKSTKTHNHLFYHFRVDTKKDPKAALYALQKAFFASQKEIEKHEQIKVKGFLAKQLLENDSFINSLANNQFTYLEAPTGIGKSYFVKHHLTPFLNKKDYVVLFAAPRNAIAKQQAIELKNDTNKIVFTADTTSEAIERLKTEKHDIVYTNFDKLADAYHVLSTFYNKKIVIVIDEAHLMTSDSTFRPKVIAGVVDTLIKNPTNLLMSATPTQLYLKEVTIKKFEVVAQDKKHYANPSLTFCANKKMTSYAFEKCKNIAEKNERAIIHLNSIEQARILQSLLKKENIGVHFLASTELTPTEKENFDSIQSKATFYWNDDKPIIITTSVLETGFNIETDRKTTTLYFNKTQGGFDNTAYRQFIARMRNYDKIEVENIIVTQNYSHFLPCQSLVLDYDYEKTIEFAIKNQELHNELYQSYQNEYDGEFNEFERERIRTEASKYLYFDAQKERFEIDYQQIFAEYTHDATRQGSPYFENPKEILFYEQKINEGVNQYEQFQKAERDRAEQEVVHLFVNDFEKLVVSVEKYTQDIKLKTRLNNSFLEEPSLLTPLQLIVAEQLLKHYFYLLKTSNSKGITEIDALKSILVDTENLTLRKTNDLRKRKMKFISYWLLLRKSNKQRLGVSESMQVQEYKRVSSIMEELKDQVLSAEQIVEAINRFQHQKKRYSKKKCFEILQLLCNLERTAKVKQGKKSYYYTFISVKDWETELYELLGEDYKDTKTT
ncbi:DEAD/DEAH box helicase (plasmid) [Bernardetia sp. OM2101]|uniref:DEAD/DEAH box helicase n=1 Tax=Bernardetia sp. OM2101 TaxID=3344876 RepID=UPI0035CF7CA4